MLANPGLSKAEGDGVRQFANILCAAPPFERDKIKKAQRRRYYVGVSMNESIIANVATIQHRRYYASVSMSESIITNVITTQLGTSCSFDSPGLASVASYPGEAFARRFNAIGVELFLRKHGYSEGIHGGLIKKAQHRWRCSPQTIP